MGRAHRHGDRQLHRERCPGPGLRRGVHSCSRSGRCGPLTLGSGGSLALLCLGIGTLVPPTLTGHSATGDYHHAAASLLIHVVGVTLWVGGLVAVAWYASQRGAYLSRVARSYSTLALGCFVMVGASGVLNAWVRIDSVFDLVTTRYGVLILGKVAALIALGWFGTMHRRRTLRELDAGRPHAFRRLAAGEIVVMASALALGVTLSRTSPPPPDDLAPASFVRELLGFPIPPEPSPLRLLTQTYPDALFALGCLAAVLLYLAGLAAAPPRRPLASRPDGGCSASGRWLWYSSVG